MEIQHPNPKTTASHFEFKFLWQQFQKELKRVFPNFEIDASNNSVLEAVLAYFLAHKPKCQSLKINPKKGLLLLGPVGCGKTTLMQLFARGRYQVIASRIVARMFKEEGNTVLERYGSKCFEKKSTGFGAALQYDRPIAICFDSLGDEKLVKLFGNEYNVMEEILLDRENLYLRYGMITHVTTRCNAEELERKYGKIVRSCLREMCNLVCFPAEAPDRRK